MNELCEIVVFDVGIGFGVNERCGRIEFNNDFDTEGTHEGRKEGAEL